MSQCQHNLVNISGLVPHRLAIWWRDDPKSPSKYHTGPIPTGLGIGENETLEIKICIHCHVVQNFDPSVLNTLET